MSEDGAVPVEVWPLIRRSDPMDLPDRAEVWVRARLRNNLGEPHVEIVDDNGFICGHTPSGVWLGYECSVLVDRDEPREVWGRGEVPYPTHHHGEPCTCRDGIHDLSREQRDRVLLARPPDQRDGR